MSRSIKSTNTVEIPDVSPKVFKTVLSYIYTGKVKKFLPLYRGYNINDDHCRQVQPWSLERPLENRLAISLNITNAAHILAVAENLSCSKLKCEAIKFITQSNEICGEVMKTEGWKEVLESRKLVEDILSSIIDPSPKGVNYPDYQRHCCVWYWSLCMYMYKLWFYVTCMHKLCDFYVTCMHNWYFGQWCLGGEDSKKHTLMWECSIPSPPPTETSHMQQHTENTNWKRNGLISNVTGFCWRGRGG